MVQAAPHLDRLTRRAGRGATGRGRTRPDDTPSGVAMHGPAADINGDGALTFTDIQIVSINGNAGTPPRPGDANDDPDADLWGNGADDASDMGRSTAYASGPTFNDRGTDRLLGMRTLGFAGVVGISAIEAFNRGKPLLLGQ